MANSVDPDHCLQKQGISGFSRILTLTDHAQHDTYGLTGP